MIKAFLAAGESLGGLGLLITPNARVAYWVDWMTRNEIAHDPHDKVAEWVQHGHTPFPIETQHFYAAYLCFHGAIKLAMVFGLARKIRWAYPAAMMILAGFVVYQVNHFLHGHSPVLLALSALDTLMIVLVWREYQLLDVPMPKTKPRLIKAPIKDPVKE